MNILLVGLNAKYIHSALGLYSIAANCRAHGTQVEVREYTINQEILYILADITVRSPVVVGIACYIWNREMVLKLAVALKKTLPGLIVVLGGPEVSSEAVDVLNQNPAVDFVVQGEGEQSTAELFEQLKKLDQMKSIPPMNEALVGDRPDLTVIRASGVAGRYNDAVDLNGGIQLVEDLDSLPFPYQQSMMSGLSKRILYYEASRGCPYSCSYCVSATTRGVRRRSINKVKEDLWYFLQHQVRQVKFVDRTFNVLPEHYRQIWHFLAEQASQTNFHFEIVADRLLPEDIEWLVTVPDGLFQFEIGVQSVCTETLRAIGRHNAWAYLQQNVAELIRAGNIHLHLDLIVGLPLESKLEFIKSFNKVYDLKPDMLQVGFLKMLPGTPIRNEADKYGYVFLSHPPYEILSNQFLSYSEVRRLKQLEEVFNQTYNSGRFSTSLAYIVKNIYGGDAFSFYEMLSDWWQRQGLLGVSHSPDSILSFLGEFANRFSPTQRTEIAELLKIDVILDRGQAMKGEGLNWNRQRWEREKSEFWRNANKVRQYCPGYKFTNWREVKRKFPVEVFEMDVAHWLGLAEDCGKSRRALLFDLSQKKARWNIVRDEDFWLEETT